jgi:uncharacterized integral membrane protein (TIGR00698 family)
MKEEYSKFKNAGYGLCISVFIGAAAYTASTMTHSPIADPLVAAMLLGIIVRSIIGENERFKLGFGYAVKIFLPIGIPLYAIKNLNFAEYAKMETKMLFVPALLILTYFVVIFVLGKILKQKKEVTYLTAAGSAICGASAIAITSPAVNAESDDVSVSLSAVALAGLVALFIILPFCATVFGMTNKAYGILCGASLQFTGFVKAAMSNVSYLTAEIAADKAASLALSIKAARYLGLLMFIPVFASLSKGKFSVPWILWLFLISGIIGTFIYMRNQGFYGKILIPSIKPVYNVSWSIAMAAVGLNANIKELLSNKGAKALIMAFAGFISAIVVFFISAKILNTL